MAEDYHKFVAGDMVNIRGYSYTVLEATYDEGGESWLKLDQKAHFRFDDVKDKGIILKHNLTYFLWICYRADFNEDFYKDDDLSQNIEELKKEVVKKFDEQEKDMNTKLDRIVKSVDTRCDKVVKD